MSVRIGVIWNNKKKKKGSLKFTTTVYYCNWQNSKHLRHFCYVSQYMNHRKTASLGNMKCYHEEKKKNTTGLAM